MKKNIIIIILAILVLGIGEYLVYDKLLTPDDKIDQEPVQDKKEEYTLIDKDNDYFISIGPGCGGISYNVNENIDEVRKYSDKLR